MFCLSARPEQPIEQDEHETSLAQWKWDILQIISGVSEALRSKKLKFCFFFFSEKPFKRFVLLLKRPTAVGLVLI